MSILIAQYRGKSLQSRLVKLLTYSEYSHSSVLFTEDMDVEVSGQNHFICAGSVIEAWSEGVRMTSSINEYHSPRTRVDLFAFKSPLTNDEEKKLARCLLMHLGTKYSWGNVFRFVPIVRAIMPEPFPLSYTRKHVFCSELVLEACSAAGRNLLERCQFWEVPPRDVSRSPLLSPAKTVYTN